ncbi:hypothetical protein RCL1_007281 [Eukaryota sp. TZLM3-RCL]
MDVATSSTVANSQATEHQQQPSSLQNVFFFVLVPGHTQHVSLHLEALGRSFKLEHIGTSLFMSSFDACLPSQYRISVDNINSYSDLLTCNDIVHYHFAPNVSSSCLTKSLNSYICLFTPDQFPFPQEVLDRFITYGSDQILSKINNNPPFDLVHEQFTIDLLRSYPHILSKLQQQRPGLFQSNVIHHSSNSFLSQGSRALSFVVSFFSEKEQIPIIEEQIAPIVQQLKEIHLFVFSSSCVFSKVSINFDCGQEKSTKTFDLVQLGRTSLFHSVLKVPDSVNSFTYNYQFKKGKNEQHHRRISPDLLQNSIIFDLIGQSSSKKLILAIGQLISSFSSKLSRDDLIGLMSHLIPKFDNFNPSKEEVVVIKQLVESDYWNILFKILTNCRNYFVKLPMDVVALILCHHDFPFDLLNLLVENFPKSWNQELALSTIERVFSMEQQVTRLPNLSTLFGKIGPNIWKLLTLPFPSVYLDSICSKAFHSSQPNFSFQILDSNIPRVLSCLGTSKNYNGIISLLNSTQNFEYNLHEHLLPIFDLFLKNCPQLLTQLFILNCFSLKFDELISTIQNWTNNDSQRNLLLKSGIHLLQVSPLFQNLIIETFQASNLSAIKSFQTLKNLPKKFDWNRVPDLQLFLIKLLPSVDSLANLIDPVYNEALLVLQNCEILTHFLTSWQNFIDNISSQSLSIKEVVFARSNLPALKSNIPLSFQNSANDLNTINDLYQIVVNHKDAISSLAQISKMIDYHDEFDSLSALVHSFFQEEFRLNNIPFDVVGRKTLKFVVKIFNTFSDSNNSPITFKISACHELFSSVLWNYFNDFVLSTTTDNSTKVKLFQSVADQLCTFIHSISPESTVESLLPWSEIHSQNRMKIEIDCLKKFDLSGIFSSDLEDLLLLFVVRESLYDSKKHLRAIHQDFPINFSGISKLRSKFSADSSLNECTLLDLQEISQAFVRTPCLQCSENGPLRNDDIDTLANLLVGSYSDFVAGDTTRNFFIDLLRDPNSLWNGIVAKVYKRDTALSAFNKKLHDWTHKYALNNSETVSKYCKSLLLANSACDRIQQLLEADGQMSVIIQLISKSNYRQGSVLFNFSSMEACLAYPKEDGNEMNIIPPNSFKEARSEAIMYQTNAQVHESNYFFLDNDSIKEFLDLCSFCSKSIEYVTILASLGYCISFFLKSHQVEVSQMQLFTKLLGNLVSTWSELLERTKTKLDFAGMTGFEITDFLMGKRLKVLLKLFPQLESLPRFGPLKYLIFPAQENSDSLESRLAKCIDESNEHSCLLQRHVSVFKVECLAQVFLASVSISQETMFNPTLTNTLLCSSEVTPSSVSCFLSGSLNYPCLLCAPEQLSFRALDVFKDFVSHTHLSANLLIVTSSDAVFRLFPSTSRKIFASSSINTLPDTFALDTIFTANYPGQGKTTLARHICRDNLFHLSGPVATNKVVDDLNNTALDGNFPLLLDINCPLDVMKGSFSDAQFTGRFKSSLDSHLYNMSLVLFSLLVLRGVRSNGSTFLLNCPRVCLELPAIKPPGNSWVDLMVSIILPKNLIEEHTVLCTFTPEQFNPSLLSCSRQNYTIFQQLLREYTGSNNTSASDILTLKLPDFEAPHPSLLSFRLLDAIISITSRQLNCFDHDHSIFKFVMTKGSNEYKQALELILGFSRRTAMLSLGHGDSVIISWQNAFNVHFVFASPLEHSLFAISGQDSQKIPQALWKFIKVRDYDSRERRMLPEVPIDTFEKQKKIRAFYSEQGFNDTLINQRFPDFALTHDCFRKQLIIATRLQINLPTILLGSSGVGKTYLLRHLVYTLFHPMFPMYELCFNAGTKLSQLYEIITQVNAAAATLRAPMYPVLFLDEVNASDYLHLVTCLVTNRRLHSISLHPEVRLVIAVNPCSAVGTEKLYNVFELPWSFDNYKMDFGSLTAEDEKDYIMTITHSKLKSSQLHSTGIFTSLLTKIHHDLLGSKNQTWMTSLRDVHRCLSIAQQLHQLVVSPNFSLWPSDRSTSLSICFALAVYVCYVMRPPTQSLRDKLAKRIVSELKIGSVDVLDHILYQFALKINKPDDIVLNRALVENLFALFCSILTRTPIIIIGVPGQSKNFGPSRVSPQVHTTAFQGSQAATSESLLHVVDSVIQKCDQGKIVIQCLLMDELSLMQSAPDNPLKTLHSILEPRDIKPLFSFVGISNNDFDAAPASRCILVQRNEHTDKELEHTLNEIFLASRNSLSDTDGYASKLVEIHREMQQVAKECLVKKSSCSKNFRFYGNRDVYALAKFVSKSFRLSNPSHGPMFLRCYGGLPLSLHTELLRRVNSKFRIVAKRDLSNLVYSQDLYSSIMENLVDHSSTARHLLLIGSLSRALHVLNQSPRANELETLVGSRFEADSYRDFTYHQLSKILTACATGKVVVLTNQENLIGALFDLLNRNFLRFNHKGVGICRVALGNTGNHLTHVHETTRIVVVCTQEELVSQPPALLNRLEKINLGEMVAVPSTTDRKIWEEYFEILGLSLVNCIDKQSFIVELAEHPQPLSFLWRLAVPSHLVAQPRDRLQELVSRVNENFVGFMRLSDIIIYHQMSFGTDPLRLVVFSNYFGDHFTDYHGFPGATICDVSAASCRDELVELLESCARNLPPQSLFIVKLDTHYAKHFPACSYLISQRQSLFHSLNIVFTIIQGSDCTLSLFDGYNLYYSDVIHLDSYFIGSWINVSDFGLHSLDSALKLDLISSFLTYSLMKSSVVGDFRRSAFETLHTIHENPDLLNVVSIVFSELLDLGDFMSLCQSSYKTVDFQSLLNSSEVSALQKCIVDFTHNLVIERLSPLLEVLSCSLLLVGTGVFVAEYWTLLGNICGEILKSSFSQMFAHRLSKFLPHCSTCDIPFAPFIVFCIKYFVQFNSENLGDTLSNFCTLISPLLGCIWTQHGLSNVATFVLNQFGFSSTLVSSWLSGCQDLDISTAFNFIATCLSDPSRKVYALASDYLTSLGHPVSMEENLYHVAGTLISIQDSSPEYHSLVSAILLYNSPPTEEWERCVLRWLRLLVVNNYNPSLCSSLAVIDLISLRRALIEKGKSLTNESTTVLYCLFYSLSFDFFSDFHMFSTFDTSNISHASSLFYCIFEKTTNPLRSCNDCNALFALIDSLILQLSPFFNLPLDTWLVPLSSALTSIVDNSLNHLVRPLSESNNFSFDMLIKVCQDSINQQSNNNKIIAGIIRGIVYSRIYVLKLKYSITRNLSIPGSVISFSFSPCSSNSLLASMKSVLFKLTLSTRTNSEALALLSDLLGSCRDLDSNLRREILPTLFYDESRYRAFISETDWCSDQSIEQSCRDLRSRKVDSINHGTLKTLVAVKRLSTFRLSRRVSNLFETFERQITFLVPFVEFMNTPISQEFAQHGDLSHVFICGNVSNSFISRFYLFSVPAQGNTTIRYCSNCFAYLLVGNCGEFAHSTGNLDYGRNTRCPECNFTGDFRKANSLEQYNNTLLSHYQQQHTPGPHPFSLEFLERNVGVIGNNTTTRRKQFLELLVIQYFGFLQSCINNRDSMNLLKNIFRTESPVAFIRDFLVSIFPKLAQHYRQPTPVVPFILAQKIRQLNAFRGSFFARNFAEKQRLETELLDFLANLNDLPLKAPGQTFDLMSNVSPQDNNFFNSLPDNISKSIMIATTINECPDNHNLIDNFGDVVDETLNQNIVLFSSNIISRLPAVVSLCTFARNNVSKSISKPADQLNTLISADMTKNGAVNRGLSDYNNLVKDLTSSIGTTDGKLQFSCQARVFPKLSLRPSQTQRINSSPSKKRTARTLESDDSVCALIEHFLACERDQAIYIYEFLQRIIASHNAYSLHHLLSSDVSLVEKSVFDLDDDCFIDLSVLFDAYIISPFESFTNSSFSLTPIINSLVSTNLLRPSIILPDLVIPSGLADARVLYMIEDGLLGIISTPGNPFIPQSNHYLSLPVANRLKLCEELIVIFKTLETLSTDQVSANMNLADVITTGRLSGFQVLRSEDSSNISISLLLNFVNIIEGSFTVKDLDSYVATCYKAQLSAADRKKLRAISPTIKDSQLLRLKQFSLRFLSIDEIAPNHKISQWDLGDDSLDFICVGQILRAIDCLSS